MQTTTHIKQQQNESNHQHKPERQKQTNRRLTGLLTTTRKVCPLLAGSLSCLYCPNASCLGRHGTDGPSNSWASFGLTPSIDSTTIPKTPSNQTSIPNFFIPERNKKNPELD